MSDEQAYLVMARESYAVAYVTIACASILLWDSIVTLDDEIGKIWSMRFSYPKILFFVNRYVVIPMQVFNGIASSQNHLPPNFCVFYLRWLVVAVTVTQAVIEAILLIRVMALYHGNKLVKYTAAFLYACGVTTLVGLTIKDYVGEPVLIVQNFNQLPGCYASSVPNIIAGYWIAPVIVESLFFGLVTWKAMNWWKANTAAPPTLVLMARDSSVYFACIFILFIVNLFVFEYGPPFLSSLFVTPVNTVGSIAGSRMMLNLRNMGRETVTVTGLGISKSSNIRFTRQERTWPDTNAFGGTYTNMNEEAEIRYEMSPLDSDGHQKLDRIVEVPVSLEQ